MEYLILTLLLAVFVELLLSKKKPVPNKIGTWELSLRAKTGIFRHSWYRTGFKLTGRLASPQCNNECVRGYLSYHELSPANFSDFGWRFVEENEVESGCGNYRLTFKEFGS